MGTFVKVFVVDGEEYELYAQTDDGVVSYDLLDATLTVIVVSGLNDIPDEEAVTALVHGADGWGDRE